jgi:hypothetical protein
LASNIRIAEDLQGSPGSIPYNDEVDRALLPHLDVLTKLLNDENQFDELDCPAKAWMQKHSKGRLGHLACPYRHHISNDDVCRIESWYDVHVPMAKENRHLWIEGPAIYHACTLLLAYRIQESVYADPSCPSEAEPLLRHRFLIAQAWIRQNTPDPNAPHSFVTDVDLEAIRDLETGLFEKGSDQEWGLDVETCNDSWNHYATYHHLPMHSSASRKRKVLFTLLLHFCG